MKDPHHYRETQADFSCAEIASILAGLRLLQRVGCLPAGIDEIRTDGGTLRGLDADAIDALCERLNVAPVEGEAA